ncbi:MAG: c-type cytochrome [Acidobacteria bacterium]|nr:c-type cytochrome [Acidobacteriota bacterium]
MTSVRTRRAWRAGFVLVSAVVLVAAANDGSVPLSLELPDNPTAGAHVFVEKNCVRCHALGGDETRVGPDLGRMHFRGTVLDLAGAFWNHAPVMREKMQDLKIVPPRLDAREMADLMAFLTAYRYYLTEVGEPGTPSAGRVVFETRGCARCHPTNGDSTWEKPGPRLDRYRGNFSGILLAQVMWNHSPEMATVMHGSGVPWPRLNGRQMGDLLAYLQAGNAGTGRDRVYFEPGSPRRGREQFANKGCIRCHAIAGVGGKAAPDLGRRPRDLVGSVSSIAALMWNHSQAMTMEFARRGVPRVTFSGREMADIIAYLYFVNYANVRAVPAHGGRLFVDKCSPCHSLGGGRRVGPDLQEAPQRGDPLAIIAAMWNHAAGMDQELRRHGLAWPRLEPGDAADLTAFLLNRRSAASTAHAAATGSVQPGGVR